MNAKQTRSRILAPLLAGILIAGCSANGGPGTGSAGGGNDGSISDGGSPSTFPNDGTTPSTVVDGQGGPTIPGHFICTGSAWAFGGIPTTEVGANGLIGGTLSDLLNSLGGTTLTTLLNSVKDKDLAIDGILPTFSTFSLTAGGLGALNSVDQIVHINDATVPSGNYAVFGVTFPAGTLALSIANAVSVTTFLGTTQQETMTFDQTALQLLGAVNTGPARAFIGLKTHKDYNGVLIDLTPSVLSADVGDAMHVNELCTKGGFVN